MGDVAASGGYWVSTGANLILADAATVTGSIGVFALRPVLQGFYDKIGLTRDELRRGRNADLFTTPEPWTEEHRRIIQRGVDHIYDLFLEKVSKGRGIPVEEVLGIAGGRVWSGTDALDRKLVDKLGGITEAIEEAKSLAGVPAGEKPRIRVFPKERSFLEKIREGDFGIRSVAAREAKRVLARYDLELRDLLPYAPDQGLYWAYMPFVVRE